MPRVKGGHVNCRRDGNQPEVVSWYLQQGCSVLDLSDIGGGCPDLLIGCAGVDGFAEVKMPGEDLRPNQVTFNRDWRGQQPWKVTTMQDVIGHVAYLRKRARTPR